ncbi:TonB-dependent receptor [Galbibacter sp. EGI 63066]|uniref:SusC/RagA family TonB-linked outer membrane protein n=1 Tax=Galbibacter sp. EGI 63066 TaxID=2993559 RepID=UPI002248D3FE|nr:TonB-dependent receptor [Galbibacter sp. EGI 63066]MCX2678665.1 TonB-dependent receptor [Galbibacter sp. EGI 63066]
MRHFLIKMRIILLFSCWGGITSMYAGSGLFVDPAQDFIVKGTVISETDNMPLPGAAVIVKGTSNGVVTDFDGNYEIKVNDPANAVLVFSFVGFTNMEVNVNGKSTISVGLKENAEALDEVVVIGFGTQKKTEVTGSVVSVDVESVENSPNTNIGQILQGTAAGVNVGVSTRAGGTPNIQIRGRSSLSGSQNVLIVLDGIQYNGSLSSINPDDIASMEILKDASSTAVYGAQGANGVLLITTKRGLTGAPRVSYSTAYTLQSPTKKYRTLNRAEYLEELKFENWDLAFLAPEYTTPNPDYDPREVADASMVNADRTELLPHDFDWVKEGTASPFIQEHNLSVSGGIKDTLSYLFSASTLKQQNFIKADEFSRKTLRANLEASPTNFLKIGLVSSGSFVNQDGAEPNLTGLVRMAPLVAPYDENGEIVTNPFDNVQLNPLLSNHVDDHDRVQYYFANIYAELKVPFIKGLKYRINYGHNLRQGQHYYASEFDAGLDGLAYKENNQYYDYTFDNIITYEREFGQHKFTLTGLYGAIERKSEGTYSEGKGFDRLDLGYNSLESGNIYTVRSNAWSESLEYQMGRLSYNFADKYLLTATVRRDGFSGFSENNKYGVFPSASVGWVVSEEGFIKNLNAVDYLKFRASYGTIGNQTSRYSSLARVSTRAAYVFGDGGTTAFGQQVNSLANPDLKWERTTGLNLAVDFAALNNRLSGTLEYYNNDTNDLLYNVNIPSLTGFSSIATNLGKINNTGLEASLTYYVLANNDFNWSITGNIWRNTNKIESLLGKDVDGDGKEDDLIASGLFIGESIGTIYSYQAGDIYQLDDEIPEGFYPGTLRVEDLNGDGEFEAENDRKILGRTEPAYSFSIYNSFSYKGLGLSFLINSVQGGKDGYLGNSLVYFSRNDNTIRENQLHGIDYWSPSNPDGKYPRNISGSNPTVVPSMYESRSFVRLQDISLSYNLPASVLNKFKVSQLMLYASAKNVYTWTKWDGLDPETGSSSAFGRPVMRPITLGLRVSF